MAPRKSKSKSKSKSKIKSKRKRKSPQSSKQQEGAAPRLLTLFDPAESGESSSQDDLLKGNFDRRVLEGPMRDALAKLTDQAPDDSALGIAQQLMYEAFECTEPEQQIELARDALDISPDCADAYVLLGDYAETPQAALALYEQGVLAGQRALGPDAFKEWEGHFWGILETRPYMRARWELARLLLEFNRQEEAITHLDDMLRLNPNDNQGARYVLLSSLVDLDRDDEAHALIQEYEEDATADWQYTRALLAFRDDGDSPEARRWIAEAIKSNPFVPAYLAGFKKLPEDFPPYMTLGGETEAQSYASGFLRSWKATPGAIAWLRSVTNTARDESSTSNRQAWRGFPAEASQLPQDVQEIWHVDLRKISSRAGDQDQPIWVFAVTNPITRQKLNSQSLLDKPANNETLQLLSQTLLEPEDGEPRRPGVVRVRLKSLCTAWTKKLAKIGIKCEHDSHLEDLDQFYVRLTEKLAKRAKPVLSDEELSGLPQIPDELWQADTRLLATWLGDEANPMRPWVTVICNHSEGTILAQDLQTEAPSEKQLIDTIRMAMSNPQVGDAHRPATLAVRDEQTARLLQPELEQFGIQCVAAEDLDMLEFVYEDLTRHMCGSDPAPALLETPGVEPRHVAGLYSAAAEFYRRKPWRSVGGDTIIIVECEHFEPKTVYAIVMGQLGMCQGLALYDDFDELSQMLDGPSSGVECGSSMSALTLQFNEPFEIPNLDLYYAETFGWAIAGPEAYPTAMKVSPGMVVHPPVAREMQLLEACLRAIPQFLETDPDGPVEFGVDTSEGHRTLKLSWA